MLEINNLTKYYGDILGISNLDLNINKGEIFGLVGPNGSGKSTTIRSIMGFIKYSGSIRVDGITNYNKDKIGYLPGEINLYNDLTVDEMIKYNNQFYSFDTLNKAYQLVLKLELDLTKSIKALSLGNLKKLGIVLALAHDPKLIILDEPTSGLDPLMQEKFLDILREEKKNDKTILFSSHVLSEITKICDRVGILINNKLVEEKEVSLLGKEYFNVQVVSPDIEKIIKELKVKGDKFVYNDINKLLNVTSKYNITKLLIEEPTIEEILMNYYKGDI